MVLTSLLLVAAPVRGDVEITYLTVSADEGANETLSLEISNPDYSPSWFKFVLLIVLVHFDWMAANENTSADPSDFPITLERGYSTDCNIPFCVPNGIADETYHNYTLTLEVICSLVNGTWGDPEELHFSNAIFINHVDAATPSSFRGLTILLVVATGAIAAVLAGVILAKRSRKEKREG